MLEYPLSPSDSEDEDTCQVYWETKSILDDHPNPLPPPPHVAKPRLPPPVAASTPLKSKRSTAAAALPSPSTSTSSARAARLAKRTRKGRDAPRPDASQRVDAGTLKLVSQLAARFNQRGNTGTPLREKAGSANVPVVGRSAAVAAPSAKGKGKEEQQQDAPPRSATLRGTASAASHLSSSKVSLSTSSTTPSTSKPPILTISRPAACSRSLTAPAPTVAAAPKEETSDEFDSYFDGLDDQSFEIALSQLEAPGLLSSQEPPPPLPEPVIASKRASAPAPRVVNRPVLVKQQSHDQPIRSSPRLSTTSRSSTVGRKPPPPQPQLARPSRPIVRPVSVTVVKAAPVTRPVQKPQLVRGSSSTSSIIIGGAGGELDEQARLELDQLVEGCGWSDGEEDF